MQALCIPSVNIKKTNSTNHIRRNIEWSFYSLFRKYYTSIVIEMITVYSQIYRGKKYCRSVPVDNYKPYCFLNFIGFVVFVFKKCIICVISFLILNKCLLCPYFWFGEFCVLFCKQALPTNCTHFRSTSRGSTSVWRKQEGGNAFVSSHLIQTQLYVLL